MIPKYTIIYLQQLNSICFILIIFPREVFFGVEVFPRRLIQVLGWGIEIKWYTSKQQTLPWLLNNFLKKKKYKFGFNHKFSILNVLFIKSSPSSWIINFSLCIDQLCGINCKILTVLCCLGRKNSRRKGGKKLITNKLWLKFNWTFAVTPFTVS